MAVGRLEIRHSGGFSIADELVNLADGAVVIAAIDSKYNVKFIGVQESEEGRTPQNAGAAILEFVVSNPEMVLMFFSHAVNFTKNILKRGEVSFKVTKGDTVVEVTTTQPNFEDALNSVCQVISQDEEDFHVEIGADETADG